MTEKAEPEIRSAYLAIAETMAMRAHVAANTLAKVKSDPNGAYALTACEVIALQLRLLCETVMLGSTMAHLAEAGKDISEKKWRPKDAFFELSQVSEHPLPIPIEIELHKNGEGQHHVQPISRPVEFTALAKVYGQCGDLLHVPTAKQVLSGKLPAFDVALLETWVEGFNRIAQSHALMLPERQIILLVTWSGKVAERPEVFRLDAMGESTMNLEEYPPFDLF